MLETTTIAAYPGRRRAIIGIVLDAALVRRARAKEARP
jgi:hypothetical protein